MCICIGDSMIKYMGSAVLFVQYMPEKPIKHGIKVFACCCAFTSVLLRFEVYLEKKNVTVKIESSVLSIVDQLITNAHLVVVAGLILYTDNWYTSVKLAKHVYTAYPWLLFRNIVPTEKKVRKEDDILFFKVSKGTLAKVYRGWFRIVILPVNLAKKVVYYIL